MPKKQKQEKTLIGVVAPIVLKGPTGKKKKLYARIDTGASKSSLDSQLVAELEIGPVKRTKMVKSASGVRLRPIVETEITISKKKIFSEFTLADRSHMKYQVLVGRNILKGNNFLVDPDMEDGG